MREEDIAADPDLERAVIAAVMLDGGDEAVFARLAPLVRPEDFYDPRHAVIWSAIRRVCERGEPVDIHTLTAELRVAEKLHTVGGAQYLGELTDEIPTLAHCESHAQRLAELADLRAARDALDRARLAARGSEESPSVAEVLSRVRVELAKIPDGARRGEVTTLDAHVERAREDILRARESALSGVATGISWGIRQMDGYSGASGFVDGIPGPLGAGQLVGLAAPGGAGKTTLAWQLCEANASVGRPVQFFAGEMKGPEIVKRRAAQIAGVSQSRLLAGRVSDHEFAAIDAAMRWLSSLPIEVVPLAGMTAADVRGRMLASRARRGTALVVVDFLQLVELPGKRSEPTEQSARIYGLKGAAVDCGVPLVAISAMTKASQRETSDGSRLPSLQDAMGSGAEYAVDIMMFLVREAPRQGERPREASVKAYVTKNRHGEGSNVYADLILDLPRGEFRDASGADDGGDMPVAAPADPASGDGGGGVEGFSDDDFGGMAPGGSA